MMPAHEYLLHVLFSSIYISLLLIIYHYDAPDLAYECNGQVSSALVPLSKGVLRFYLYFCFQFVIEAVGNRARGTSSET